MDPGRDSGEPSAAGRMALILPGGGAYGAYQVGALTAIAEIVAARINPFAVIIGTSAGAVAASVLGAGAARWPEPVAQLGKVWANFHVAQVVHVERSRMLRSGLRWLSSLVTAGQVKPPRSLLDSSPLRELLRKQIDFAAMRASLATGAVHAIGVCATSYDRGESVTFFDGAPEIPEWQRPGRLGQRAALTLDHVLASAALPVLFPAVSIGAQYFGDGAMLQVSPLSAAIHLGASRVLIVGVRRRADARAASPDTPRLPPAPADVLGLMLDSLFSNQVFRDLDLAQRLNRLVGVDPAMRRIETLRIEPSVNLAQVAARFRDRLPGSVRALLGVLGGGDPASDALAGYLLFEAPFTRELMSLGYHDVMLQRDAVRRFALGD